MDRVPVIDAHCDTLQHVLAGKGSLVEGIPEAHVDVPRLREGGVNVQVFACWVPTPYRQHAATLYALRLIAAFYRELAAHPDALCLVRTAADVPHAMAKGKIAAILSLEGAEPLEGYLDLLDVFFELGVRWLGLTWNYRNQAADGVLDAESGGGLTRFGKDLVRACGERGIVVDVSHLAPAGVRDVLRLATGPIVASHSNAKALCDHPRNLPDDLARGIAETGGVVGVTFVPAFLRREGPPSMEDVLDHIAYLADRIGVDHVGIGSDFDGLGESAPPQGLEDVSRYGAIREGLARRGFREQEIAAIMGGNWWRVLQQVLPTA